MNKIIEKIVNGEATKTEVLNNNTFFKKYNIEESRKVVIVEHDNIYMTQDNNRVKIDSTDLVKFKNLAEQAGVLLINEKKTYAKYN